MSTIAIVCAMERELQPFTKNWKRSGVEFQARTFRVFEQNLGAKHLVAVAGGIGIHAAQLAARAVLEKYRPEVLISAGFAGGLVRSLKVGCVITPNVIVDARSGNEYRCTPLEDFVAGGVSREVSRACGGYGSFRSCSGGPGCGDWFFLREGHLR